MFDAAVIGSRPLPYSLDFNMIEQVFSKSKVHLREIAERTSMVWDAIARILDRHSQQNVPTTLENASTM